MPGTVGPLEGLQRAVLRPGRGREPGVLPDGLVVVARHDGALAEQPADGAGAVDRHQRRTVGVPARIVPLVPDDVRHVLVQGPAGVHGHDLHPAADPERRLRELHGHVEEGQLPGVPVRVRSPRARVRFLAVGRRVDVRAAGDDERVEPFDDGPRRRAVRRRRRQDDGNPARAADGVGVDGGQQVGDLVPDAVDGPLAVAADADDGSGGHSGVT